MRGLGPCLAVSALALATSFANDARAESPPVPPPATSAPPATATTAPVPGDPAQLAPSSSAPGAGGATPLPPASSVPTRRWYGAGIIVVDAVSLIVLPLVATQTPGGGAIAGVSVVGYVVGGPAIHALNGARPGVIGGSIALRLGLPLVGLLIGVAIGESSGSSCGPEDDDALCGLAPALDGLFGMAIGLVTASVIDSAALAWTSAKPDAVAPPASRQSLRLTPLFGIRRDDPRRDGAVAPTFGVAGTF
jgi:hypothetical protein